VRRFVASQGYARAKVATGVLFVALGVLIVGRTLAALGFSTASVAPLVMGAAIMGLGVMRVRDYFARRRNA
jgi:hypothetical protein